MTRLDIFSDPICPWCYIGKLQLDAALAETPPEAPPFEIRWHPYFLNPDMPRAGMDRRAYLEAKFGSREAVVEAYMPIDEQARALGITLNHAGIERTPNTLDAQRLIHWAEIEGAQHVVVSALFEAYFQEGRDIGAPETLADIADSAGIDAAMVQRLLATDADCEEIQTRAKAGQDMGITGVPCFIVGRAHAVPGAQPADLWRNVIKELYAASANPS